MIRRALRNWKAKSAFQKLTTEQRQLVFYAEDGRAWNYLGPIVEELVSRQVELVYLTSAPEDPILEDAPPGVTSFCIGQGTARTALFLELRTRVMVMTMPDLETFHIKRSVRERVHYLYVPHSMVSTHMVYRPAAFDHFDTVLCVGPHHVSEIRARECLYQLPRKNLVECGYAPLDLLRANRPPPPDGRTPTILLAPSWGTDAILESLGLKLVQILLDSNFRVVVRPHPVTRLRAPAVMELLRREFSGNPNFELEPLSAGFDSLLTSDLMISDWSGVALEYAFGLERPVIFIDVPRKVNNQDYQSLAIEPFEVTVRPEIGEVVGVDSLPLIPEIARRLQRNASHVRNRLIEARANHIFNPGRSAQIAADTIMELL